MASNARRERRQLWWKQHGKQVEDFKDTNKTKTYKKSYHKEVEVTKEKQSASTSAEETSKKKTRFIVFVGNLPFDLEKEDIIHHFRCVGGVTDFRLMTRKDGGTSKGCGFLELNDFVSYEKALNLHHSVVGGRKINVEVTCGGGGSGEKRVGKLNEKKKKFRERRGKKSKSIKKKTDSKSDNDSLQSNKKVKKESMNLEVDIDESVEVGSVKDKKRKLTEKSTDFDKSCMPKKKKKSLKESNALNSIVKELELETIVQERQEKSVKGKKEKKKKLKYNK